MPISEVDPTINMLPSASARAVYWAAIAPAAPGMFSTTTLVPNFSVNLGANVRAMMSVPPPGVNGTINFIGFSGLDCWASKVPLRHPQANTQLNATRMNLFMTDPIQKMVIDRDFRQQPQNGASKAASLRAIDQSQPLFLQRPSFADWPIKPRYWW